MLAGVYVLYSNGKIVNAGQSYRTCARIYSHLSGGMEFDSWRTVQIENTPSRLLVYFALTRAANSRTSVGAARGGLVRPHEQIFGRELPILEKWPAQIVMR